MELSVDFEGCNSTSDAALLQEWLHEARIRNVERVFQKEELPAEGEQGPTLLAILTIILGSSAVVELVRCVHRYIEARKPRTKIKIKGKNKTIEIDCVNPPPLADLVDQAKRLAEE